MITPNTTSKRRRTALAQAMRDYRATFARRLDLLADAELQQGHHAAAERLAHRAAEMREGAR